VLIFFQRLTQHFHQKLTRRKSEKVVLRRQISTLFCGSGSNANIASKRVNLSAPSTAMNGNYFSSLIDSAFRPFLSDLGFTFQSTHLSGRYYRATFVEPQHTLVVTFEPGDEEVVVMLLTNGDDSLKAIDDSAITPRLGDLNARYMSETTARARKENNAYFGQFEQTDPAEKMLLKCAKDLRLVLLLHLGKILGDLGSG
jgi:hypothetical protein